MQRARVARLFTVNTFHKAELAFDAMSSRPVFLAVNAPPAFEVMKDIWTSCNPIWPTPDVQTGDFTGFLDPENVGLGTEITVLCT